MYAYVANNPIKNYDPDDRSTNTDIEGNVVAVYDDDDSSFRDAFGGTFVEEHSNTNRTPYLFNGKELDEETGLYYYGARYYDEQTSIFMSVDPLAEKFPGWSPYTYVFNNPTGFTDPTGMEGEDGVTDPPTKEQEAAMAKSDKENGAGSEKYAVRADRINDGQSTTRDKQVSGNSGQGVQNGGGGEYSNFGIFPWAQGTRSYPKESFKDISVPKIIREFMFMKRI